MRWFTFFNLSFISKVQTDHLGEYTCVARDSQTAAEGRAWLRLAYISQSAVLQPFVQSKGLGSRAVLECRVDAQPSASFSWMLNGAGLTPSSGISMNQVSPGISRLVVSLFIYVSISELRFDEERSIAQANQSMI